MNQATRTLCFVTAAAAALGLAAGTHYANRPLDLSEFSDVGQKFYPTFEDPNQATGLQVASYNVGTGKTDVFSVEFKDGLWRIPSHHGYPADAQDRLAQTAASMVGVSRQALMERTAAAHKKYNLLDPLKEDTAGTEGRGDRITLKKGDDTLVDFIVGKKVEGKETSYYVRRADEDRFYMADLGKFAVSTKFSEWIDKDVLNVTTDKIRELLINRYYVDEARQAVVPEDQIKLHRTASTAPWAMDGINVETQEVKTAEVTNLISTLDGLQIVGVRKKPETLIQGLKNSGTLSIDRSVMRDLQEKGFFVVQGQFFSNEGEVTVGTDEGVLYVLGFGEEFAGSEVDIEVGKARTEGEVAKPETDAAQPAAGDTERNAEPKAETPLAAGEKKSRYLFVTVHFDPSLLGPEPVAPVKPEEPKVEAAPANPPADGAPQQPATPSYPDALKRYQEAVEDFEFQKKQHADKVAAGKKRVDELNRRFAEWYYVISDDVFARLKLKREDLVQAKAPPEKPAENAGGGNPLNGLNGLNGLNLESLKNMIPGLGENPAAPQGDAIPPANPPAGEMPAANPPTGDNAPAAVNPPAGAEPPQVPQAEPLPPGN